MSKDRGRVLLAVRIHSLRFTVFLWGIVIVWASLLVFGFLKRNSMGLVLQVVPNFLTAVVVIFGYAVHPRIKFYEEGVEIPPTRDQQGPRYLRWDQIERSSWDGDRLVLIGTSSVLAGGPVPGGAVRIPSGEHLAVDQVLGTKLPRTKLPVR
jgi:hypothetical protein